MAAVTPFNWSDPMGVNTGGRPRTVKPTYLQPAGKPLGLVGNNVTPEAVQRVQDQYMKAQILPPGLAPRYMGVQETKRRQAITKGWADRTGTPHKAV